MNLQAGIAKLGARVAAPIPARAGVGLKPEHYRDILEDMPDIGWFEVHPENYIGADGPPHHMLERARASAFPIGGAGSLDGEHLARLKALVEHYQPGLFSEHLAWSTHEGAYLGDLLPLPPAGPRWISRSPKRSARFWPLAHAWAFRYAMMGLARGTS